MCYLTIFIFVVQAVFAQHNTVRQKPAFDSSTNKFINSFKQFGVDEERRNIIEYSEDPIATKQDEIIEEILTGNVSRKGDCVYQHQFY